MDGQIDCAKTPLKMPRVRLRWEEAQTEMTVPSEHQAIRLRTEANSQPTLGKWKRCIAKWRRKHRSSKSKARKRAASSRWHGPKDVQKSGLTMLRRGPSTATLLVATVKRHTGVGLHVSKGLLSIAVCHSVVRRACRIGDFVVVSSSLPSREAFPPAYAEAVRNLQGRHVAVALLRVDDLVKPEVYHTKRGFGARRDRWYRTARTTDQETWTVRGHKFARRGRIFGDTPAHKWGHADLEPPVLLSRAFCVWPVSLEGAPLLPPFLHKTWGGKGCLKAPNATLALRNVLKVLWKICDAARFLACFNFRERKLHQKFETNVWITYGVPALTTKFVSGL